jgi:hypothetical protein
MPLGEVYACLTRRLGPPVVRELPFSPWRGPVWACKVDSADVLLTVVRRDDRPESGSDPRGNVGALVLRAWLEPAIKPPRLPAFIELPASASIDALLSKLTAECAHEGADG